jgi:cytochrome c oxidase subunit I
VDHKRVGRRYLTTAFVFLLLGGMQAMVIRWQLAQPEADVVSADTYNQLLTMHGTTMIFLFNTPVLAGFANYLVPLQIGARDMAFPRLNAFSYWVYLLAGAFLYTSFLVGQVPDGGWFAYVPLTSMDYSPDLGLDFWAIGVVFVGLSTTAGAINFLVTVFKLRAPGMTVSRIPIFTWSVVAMSLVILFALPAITVGPLLLELQRAFGMPFFEPAAGGDPILYQHLFWFWGHPEVYILFLPATGIVSTVVATASGRRLVGYAWVVTSLLSIAFISFGVWVHHMFVTGLPALTTSFFSAVSLAITVPSGVQFFAWLATLWSGRPRWHTTLLFASGFLFIFLLGGFTGVMVAVLPFDQLAHDTYFVVAHFHYVLIGGVVFPIFAGMYHWWPKITGRLPRERIGRVAFWTMLVGFNLGFFPQHILGLWGMPRRVYTYDAGLGWDGLNLLSSIGGAVFGVGVLIALGGLVWTLLGPPDAGDDPWQAGTLEWATTSPPPVYNFTHAPLVRDRNPLWGRHRTTGADAPQTDDDLALAPDELTKQSLATAGPSAGLEEVEEAPGPSIAPLAVAASLLVLAVAMLLESLAIGLVGTLGVVVATIGWYASSAEPTRSPPATTSTAPRAAPSRGGA